MHVTCWGLLAAHAALQTKSDLSRMLSELAAAHKQLNAANKRLQQVRLWRLTATRHKAAGEPRTLFVRQELLGSSASTQRPARLISLPGLAAWLWSQPALCVQAKR